MIEIWFFVGLILLNVVCIVSAIKKDLMSLPVNLLATILCTIALIVKLYSIPSQSDIYEFKKEYQELYKKVELYNTLQDPELKAIFYEDLNSRVSDINSKIIENKFNYQSKWKGYRYSQEIGELEEINL